MPSGHGRSGHRVLALHGGVRAAPDRAVHHQGPGPGRHLDRGVQPRPAAFRTGHARWTTNAPCANTPRRRRPEMRGLLRSEQPGTVLAEVKATPCGWPTASPDPGWGRSRMTTGGADREKSRARSTQLGFQRFEGICRMPDGVRSGWLRSAVACTCGHPSWLRCSADGRGGLARDAGPVWCCSRPYGMVRPENSGHLLWVLVTPRTARSGTRCGPL